MELKVKCPICDNDANCEIWNGPLGTEEEHITCDICGYHYDFAYGNYFEVIGNKWFIWDWTKPLFTDFRMSKKMDKALFMARRRWKKHRKGCNPKNCPI